MEERESCTDLNLGSSDVDDEFKSCGEEDEDWQDADESLSEGPAEGNQGDKEEGDRSSLRISEILEEEAESPLRLLMEFGEVLDESVTFSKCPVRLLSSDDRVVVPECSLKLFNGHDENVLECSLRLCEDYEEVISVCSLGLCKIHEEDASECSLRLSEGEEDVSDCVLRLSEGKGDNDIWEPSLMLCEAHGGDASECSSQLSEDEDVSECSLVFSEGHENNIFEVSARLVEDEVEDDDGFLVRVFSKGISAPEDCGLAGFGISGIGVIMEKPHGVPFLRVQKKLDFFVEELIAEHLALMDGLLEALRNGYSKVLAFTDSNKVYRLITRSDTVEDQLLMALRERIQELTDKFESFVIRLVPGSELKRPLQLAQEAIGVLCELMECSTCGEDKHLSKMIEMNCSHKVCFDCMCIYVKNKVQGSHIPVKCPQVRCDNYMSSNVCRSLLSAASFEGVITESEAINLRFYCPFPDCSMMLHSQTLLIQSSLHCIECPECCRLVCSRCQVPWHSSLSCEEYQNLSIDETSIGHITLHQLEEHSSWRRCPQCRQMIELAEGCYHVTCWCSTEFCFACGAEYRGGARTCRCERRGEDTGSSPAPSSQGEEAERWRWDCFNPLPSSVDGYTEQEKTQLALIQRFLAGGVIDLDGDGQSPCQSPSRSPDGSSYLDDAIKDLNQLPWLESFISVIGDSYQEDHIY